MRFILIGAGVAALIVPMLYAFGLIWVWATVRNHRLRQVIVTVMLVIVILLPLKIGYQIYADSQDQQHFSDYCQQHPTGEVFARARNVKAIIANYDRYDQQQDEAIVSGTIAFPFYMASRMLLSGIEPFEVLAILTEAGYERAIVDADGRVKVQKHRREQPKIRFGFDWENNSISTHESIDSLSLVVRDLKTNRTLATQPVFLMITPGIKLFPSLPFNPWPVQQQRVRSCPDAAGLARFIKTVVKPKRNDLNDA